MKSKDLIRQIQEIDPDGEKEVVVCEDDKFPNLCGFAIPVDKANLMHDPISHSDKIALVY